MRDPMDKIERTIVEQPPLSGRGSGREVWIRYALKMAASNQVALDVADAQSATIKALEGEITLLRKQIAERKPAGGKPRLDDELVDKIEQAIEQGASDRDIAARYAVCAMSVWRARRRIKLRAKAAVV